jgi:hypothetical protein
LEAEALDLWNGSSALGERWFPSIFKILHCTLDCTDILSNSFIRMEVGEIKDFGLQ